MKKQIRIVVDAMGGDFAPVAAIEGSVAACREYRIEVMLAGNKATIQEHLRRCKASYLPLSILHADDVLTMQDNPLDVVRKKKQSSISIGMRYIDEGKADAFVSAGNSGAVASAALFILKRIKGIDRPAIATILPNLKGHVVVADAGANNAVKPFNLVQFAIMSSVYSKYFLGVSNPRVGLLSNGEEDSKGTEIIRSANELLRGSRLHYTGFVEGGGVFKGDVDGVEDVLTA